MASIGGLGGSTQSQAVLDGSLQLNGANHFFLSTCCISRICLAARRRSPPAGFCVKAQADYRVASNKHETSRREMLGLFAAAAAAAGLGSGTFVQNVLAEEGAKPIKIGPPPPPSGGLPGTLNSDEARDLDLPLKERFFLQPLPPAEAAKRAKESAQEILNVKQQIEKKAWPYVQNDLRSKAGYLRFDLNTVISAKPKAEKQQLKELTKKLYDNFSGLDHAAKIKSSPEAEKYYALVVSSLNDVIANI